MATPEKLPYDAAVGFRAWARNEIEGKSNNQEFYV